MSGRLREHCEQLIVSAVKTKWLKVFSDDYDNAAAIYRACRKLGVTIKAQIDCLIAAIAIRTNTKIVHHDSDFDAIAQVTKLKIHPAKR